MQMSCVLSVFTCTLRGNGAPAQQPVVLNVSLIRLGVTSSVWSLASCTLPAPLPLLGSEVGRERERAQAGEGAALTSGARIGNNGDVPQGDSGRQEQAQTQEPSILPLRQTCRGLRIWRRNCLSLYCSLSLFDMP